MLSILAGCGSPLSEEEQSEAASLVRANLMCSMLVRHAISTSEMDARTEDEHFELGYLIYDRSFLTLPQLTLGQGDYNNFDEFVIAIDESVGNDIDAVADRFGNTAEIRSRLGRQLYEAIKKGDQKKSGYSYESCGSAYVIGKRFYDERFN